MTADELRRISTGAMLAAREAHARNENARWPSDFGRRARAWERLADAADALSTALEREASVSRAEPLAAQAVV